MNLPFHIATKYFGKYLNFRKSLNSIQVLTAISIVAALIISLASVIVLSVFNGLTFLLGDLNAVFYPQLKVEPAEEKVFRITDEELQQIKALDDVVAVSEVLEEDVIFSNEERQVMGVVKGVDEEYLKVSDIEQALFRGNFNLRENDQNHTVIGLGITNELALNTQSPFSQLDIYIPQRKQRVSFMPGSILGKLSLKPTGEFAIQKEFDEKYAFLPIEALRPLLQYGEEISYLEIKLTDEKKDRSVAKQIQKILGDKAVVKNREQQNETWFKVMRFEKWMSFAILFLIMLIASFNLLSSLTMIVLDKKKDISILKSMGLQNHQIGSIFRWQGLLIGLVGALLGTGIASAIVLAQEKFGFIPLQGSFVVDSYPIKLKLFDVLLTIFAVVLISYLASILPANRAQKQLIQEN